MTFLYKFDIFNRKKPLPGKLGVIADSISSARPAFKSSKSARNAGHDGGNGVAEMLDEDNMAWGSPKKRRSY